MNKILRMTFTMVASISLLCSCVQKETMPDDTLPVTVHNISGNWELVEINGEALPKGSFFYIHFIRNDRTYEIWTNFNSYADAPEYMTGSFNIKVDEYALLLANYDFGYGDWNNNYILTVTPDTMTWVAEDDPTFVQKFVRVDFIPYDDPLSE